jgi:CRISPR-associated endonuclease/helicase Cas3
MAEGDIAPNDTRLLKTDSRAWLRLALHLAEDQSPFPWQEELLERMLEGEIPRALDIPTGLGKTAVMSIWLVARAMGAAVPRRLVYIVDRRAIVDQATDEAKKLRVFVAAHSELRQGLRLGEEPLPISTLRGAQVDNKEWLANPATPAIIVGTVDMIGSRLLFAGFGVSRKMRPYHAGLLGADSLLVLDEAHLVPPFEKLLQSIVDDTKLFGVERLDSGALVPPVRLLTLSATGRGSADRATGLLAADLNHPVVRRRLDASKRLIILPPIDQSAKLADALAKHAWELADEGQKPVRVIVFCDRRKDAVAALNALTALAGSSAVGQNVDVDRSMELFVGGRRVREREGLAVWLDEHGFLASRPRTRDQPSFVFATSAGEVGVDLDADHMVCDLVPWERMVQRLGRVNRRGEGDARVLIVAEPPSRELNKARGKAIGDRNRQDASLIAQDDRKQAVVQLIQRLPARDGAFDGSPGTIRDLKMSASSDDAVERLMSAATTPAPSRPALSRAVVDAWAMTSLKDHTGRPEIAPWIRGWIEEEPPQTSIVWRRYLPVRLDRTDVRPREVERFFEAAPPHASEYLETETYDAVSWLIARANAISQDADPVIAIALTPAGDLRATWERSDLALDSSPDAKRRRERIEDLASGCTVIVSAGLGGLSNEGLLDPGSPGPAKAIDDDVPWILMDSVGVRSAPADRIPAFKISTVDEPAAVGDPNWHERLRLRLGNEDGGERWLVVAKWRDDATTEDDRSEGQLQFLQAHQERVEEYAKALAVELKLPDAYIAMLCAVASVHDEGKRAPIWKRAFRAPSAGEYAKTPGPLNVFLLDGYRHEFGSLPAASASARFADLREDLRDLGHHLIAAHHGYGRPIIGIGGCDDAPPSALRTRARDVALRFARLNRRWGPWGLAWWEALFRAADQRASSENSASDVADAARV